jgi:serine/threonine protein kinase
MSKDLIGHTLQDRYFLRELAGSGGMADVFSAWDNLRSTTVAIKVLRRDLANRAKTSSMFAQEAELLRRLEHPSIVRLYEFEREGDIAFLVMDWVNGINLRDKIQKHNQPLSLAETSRILDPVCKALNYAHNKKVYHCDVKPPNILMHDDGRVLLTDFGVARLAGDDGTGGTPPYMAPEQFTEGDTGPYTDIYGLGITLYEVLSGGNLPFRGESPMGMGSTPRERIAWEHVNLPIPPLRSMNPDINGGVERVVMTALDKDPSRRFPSTLALLSAFEQARLEAGPERTGPAHTPESIVKTIIGSFQLPKMPTPPAPKPMSMPSTGSSGPVLYGREGVFRGRLIQIPKSGSLLIGRNSTNQIHLPDQSVSRVHASIIITQRGVYIQDESSSFGTLLNGQKLQPRIPAILKHGDVIQIGYQQVFEFRKQG